MIANNVSWYIQQKWRKNSFPSHEDPWDGADLRFCSPQPDTSLRCETTYTRLEHRVVCLFTPQRTTQLAVAAIINRNAFSSYEII